MATKKVVEERLLDQIDYPEDLRQFQISDLRRISDELREETINAVSQTGGHLGAGLGVVELTVALHYVFDTPKDLIVWDIGHQAYPHKILTGRKDQMHTLRQGGGLSGFLKRSESRYDTFGAGHSSTSISAALGMAAARDLNHSDKHVVAVIGDGALTAGMVYEAMNNAGHLKSKMIVVLNDNEMSIAPNLGAMRQYLSRLMSSESFLNFRQMAKNFLHHMPEPIENFAKKTKQYAKDMVTGGNFFEEMGFHYVGPLDGHDVESLAYILENLKNDQGIESPILLHIKTQKGKGFKAPFDCKESYHAIAKFDPETKEPVKAAAGNPTYTKVFGETLTKLAKQDDKVVAITAAMPSGTGINIFEKEFPERTYDVGIAEQHAVTFAAGMAAEGIKPFVAIYSTFLQRGYDQVVHDVVLQNLPVRFMLDRAGLVGADGPTHAGSFDLSYLCCLPNIVVMAPSDEAELALMMETSRCIDDMPSAIRYPRGEGTGAKIPEKLEALPIGKGRIVKQGKDIAILSLGTRLQEAMKAADILAEEGVEITVADARFAKPIDEELVSKLAKTHRVLITIEEGSVGGFGSWVSKYMDEAGLRDDGCILRTMFLPDEFIDHDSPNKMYDYAGLNAKGIVSEVMQFVEQKQQQKKSGMNYPSIEQVAEIATEAAKLVMDYYNGPMLEAFRKEDNSPVTEADKNASDLIINRLKAISDLPVVSEEEDEKYNLSVIQSASEYWLVDPIDGTWSFINRAGDFTVNIALIKDGAPIMGVVHAPLTDICYCGTVGEGAYKIENGQKIIMSPRIVNADEGYDFLVSSQNLNQRMQDFLALYDVKTITPIPSSVKFALIADGQGDIYPRFKKTSIWDTGAGHAILKAIGGEVLQLDGKPLVYNQGIINPNFVAISSTKISLPAIEDFTVFPW